MKVFTLRLFLASFILALFLPTSLKAQSFSVSGQIGYASPQGDAFKDPVTGKKQSSAGFGYEFDALYYLESIDDRLAVGLMFDGNALFGKNSEDAFDIGVYGLAIYGVKGQYRFREPRNSFSPYASLGLGLSQFSTPDITFSDAAGNETTTEGESASSFGIRPELGLDIGGFLISVAYMVPMKYTIESETGNFDGIAGALSFSLGYRYNFEF